MSNWNNAQDSEAGYICRGLLNRPRSSIIRHSMALIDKHREVSTLSVISATRARIHFGEVMQRAVEKGETIVVERKGKPYVVVLSVETYDRLQVAQEHPDWRETLVRIRDYDPAFATDGAANLCHPQSTSSGR